MNTTWIKKAAAAAVEEISGEVQCDEDTVVEHASLGWVKYGPREIEIPCCMLRDEARLAYLAAVHEEA